MATTVRFLFHTTLFGRLYLPGDVASFSDVLAEELIAGNRAVDPGAPTPPVTVPDPLSQYALDTDLAALKNKVRQDLVAKIKAPQHVAHRGGSYLNGEHSMSAYRAAANGGFIVEPDLYALSDGTLVPCHDPTVDRTMKGGTGNVSSFNLAGWRKLRIVGPVGGMVEEPPPTWAQIADEFGGRVVLMPEAKVAGVITPLVNDIIARGIEKSVVVQSFTYSDCITAVNAGIDAMFLSDTADPATLVADGVKYLGCGTGVASSYIDSHVAAGIKVWPYASNTYDNTQAFIAQGCIGVFSDDPWQQSDQRTKSDSDPFASKKLWPGWLTKTIATKSDWRFDRDDEFGSYGDVTGKISGTVTHKWAGQRGPHFSVRWRLRWAPSATQTATDRWGPSMHYTENPSPGTPCVDQAQAGVNGYHAIPRRNGTMQLYKYTDGVGSKLAEDLAGDTTVPYTDEKYVDFELTVDATGVTFKNLTTGHTISAADTTYRFSDGWLGSTWNAQTSFISKVHVRDLA